MRAIERGLDHAVDRKIRLHLRVVDVVALLAYHLSVVAPIPWSYIGRLARS